MPLIEALFRNARNRPDHDAAIFLDGQGRVSRSLTHAALAARAAALARQLRHKGSRTALLIFDSGPEFSIALFACQIANVAAVPLPPTPAQTQGFHWNWLRELINDTQADLILSAGPVHQLLGAHRDQFAGSLNIWDISDFDQEAPLADHEPQPNNPRLLLYTSGSTSAPKGVQVEPRHLAYNAATCCDAWAIDRDSVLISWMPYHHSFGLIYNAILPVHAGCTLVVAAPKAFLQDPALWFRMVSQFKGTHGAAATFGYQLCSQRINPADVGHLDLSSWRVGLISAEPIRRGVTDTFMTQFADLGLPKHFFCPLYGLSESGPITSQRAGEAMVWDSGDTPTQLDGACVGKPLPDTQIRVVNPDTLAVLDENQSGEILVSGPSVLSGYFRREQVNATAFVNLPNSARFFRTGDQGFIRNGGVYITSRIKEIMIVRGRNFYPMDLEWLARESDPRLKSCTVAAFACEGERPIHLVIERPAAPLDENAVAKTVAAAIARELGLTPDHIHWTETAALPKTASGKIRRSTCRQALLADSLPKRTSWSRTAGESSHSAQADDPLDQLIQLFAAAMQLPVEEIDEQAPLSEWPLDSVMVMELTAQLETLTGNPVKPTLFFKAASIADMVDILWPS